MRTVMAALLCAAFAQPSLAQPGHVKTDPMNEPNAEMSAESEQIMMLQEFTKKLEEAGFKDIQLGQGIILQAKDKFDKPIMMLVDPETMVGIQLKGQPDSETTGSGLSDENRFPSEQHK